MTDSRVLISIENQIATVTLNRPDKLNALDFSMFQEIDQAIKQLKKNRDIRAILLMGNGSDFCSGLDIKSVLKKVSTGIKLLWKWLPGNPNIAQRVNVGWREIPVPVIAVIQGRCWGGGLQIALGADFRIATEDATFSIMEGKWGLIPDMGGTLALREFMPVDKAMELAMTAEVFDARQALEFGLIKSIEPNAHQAAISFAKKLCEKSPDAIAGVKKLYHKAWIHNQRQILTRETFYQLRIITGKNRIQAAKRQTTDPQAAYIERKNW